MITVVRQLCAYYRNEHTLTHTAIGILGIARAQTLRVIKKSIRVFIMIFLLL